MYDRRDKFLIALWSNLNLKSESLCVYLFYLFFFYNFMLHNAYVLLYNDEMEQIEDICRAETLEKGLL